MLLENVVNGYNYVFMKHVAFFLNVLLEDQKYIFVNKHTSSTVFYLSLLYVISV